MNKSNQHCGVPLHAVNVSFPLQKLNPEHCVAVSYVCIFLYVLFCSMLSTSLLMEILHLLLGNHSGLCDLFSLIGAGPVLNLTKIRYLHVHRSVAYIIVLLSAEGPILESMICLCKMLLN